MKIPKTDDERHILWTLRDLAIQTLDDDTVKTIVDGTEYEMFSGFIRANATALRLLEEYGMVEILDPDKGTDHPEWYRCVHAHALTQEQIVEKWSADKVLANMEHP